MRRLLFLLTICLVAPLCALAQGDTPPHPNWEETDKAYTLKVECVPNIGRTSIDKPVQYKAGSNVYLTAYEEHGSYFDHWLLPDGTTSTEKRLTITMPAHDAVVYAYYYYAPGVPESPEFPKRSYTLTLTSDPLVGAKFNMTKPTLVEEGAKVRVTATLNPGFEFLNWDYEGMSLGILNSFDFTMPSHDVELVAHTVYTPSAPNNPHANKWTEEVGNVYISEFEPGSLVSTLNGIIGGSTNQKKITHLTIAGKLKDSDLNFLSNCTGLAYVNMMNATTEQGGLPKRVFKGMKALKEVELSIAPVIEAEAFSGCIELHSLNLYCEKPPYVEKDAFKDVPTSLVVYVPAESVAAYQATEFWSNYTIKPMRDRSCSLAVSLPSYCYDGRYKNMRIVIRNIDGESRHYVVTNRLNYIFENLLRHDTFTATLETPDGTVLSTVGPMTLDDDFASMSLSTFTSLYSAHVSVHAQDIDVEVLDKMKIVWEDANGNFLCEGPTSPVKAGGTKLYYTITLPESMMTDYAVPERQQIYIQDGNNDQDYTLQPLPWFRIQGRVYKTPLQPWDNTRVTMTQTVNGRKKVYSTVTGHDGEFELKIHRAESVLEVFAEGVPNIQYTYTLDDLNARSDGYGNVDLTDVQHNPSEKTNWLTLHHTYQPTEFDGKPNKPVPYYHDVDDLFYTMHNKTQNKDIWPVNLTHPNILLHNVEPGDVVEVTCHSKSSAFTDVTTEVKIDADKKYYDLYFPIVQYGSVKSTVLVTDNPTVMSLLYDTKTGKLVERKRFEGDNNVIFENVPDGHYKVVTMGETEYYNSLNSLEYFGGIGLIQDYNYKMEEVDVTSGKTCWVKFNYVPLFKNDVLFYTDKTTTTFVADKSQTIIDNVIKLTAHVDFKEKYRSQISNAKVSVEIPQTVEFVEGSVMVADKVVAYDYADNVLTVDLGQNYSDGVRLCVRPKQRGNYTANAFVSFDYTFSPTTPAQHIKQPIGGAAFTATDITLWAEPIIATPDLLVDGNAPSNALVEVYDGYTYLGSTTALGNGYWSLKANLNNPRNLSIHPIKAVVTKEGENMESEVKAVEYNEGAIQAKDVVMTFYNNNVNRTIWVQWDLEHGTTSSKGYQFSPAKDFIFKANLTDNNSPLIKECYIRVFTTAREWVDLPARYIEGMDRWVATGHFGHDQMPIGVRVAVVSDLATNVSADQLDDIQPQDPSSNNYVFEYIRENPNWAAFPVEVPADMDWESEDDRYDDGEFPITGDDDIKVQRPWYATNYVVSYENKAVDEPYYPPFDDEEGEVEEIETDRDNITVKYREYNDGTIIIEPSGSTTVWNFNPVGDASKTQAKAKAKAVGKERIATEIVSELKGELYLLSSMIQKVTSTLNSAGDYWQNYINNASTDAEKEYGVKQLARINQGISVPRDLSWLMSYGHYAIEDINEWRGFIDRIRPCDGRDDAQAWAMVQLGEETMAKLGERYIKAMRVGNLSAFMLKHYGEPNVGDYGIGQIEDLRAEVTDYLLGIAMEMYKQTKAMSRNKMRQAKRDRNRLECNYTAMETIDDAWDFTLPYPVVEPIIDPSGYVYEAVPSNRQEGVTATVYYKEKYTDEMGDERYNEVLWNAEDYGQLNPLYTDSEGSYSWDVPTGEWRVKFEKLGYQTTYSDWLPVPPPQLDVNVAIKQRTQPEVSQAKAYEASGDQKGGVDITFDKYMRPETLTSDILTLTAINALGEETLVTDYEISFPDEEKSMDGEAVYARQLTLLTDKLEGMSEVKIRIDRTAESYLGIRMLEDYEQTLDIEKKIRSFVVDSVAHIAFGKTTAMKIAALPTEAAAGRTITITSEQGEILALDNDGSPVTTLTVTLDADGQADLSLIGMLYGTTQLLLSDDDDDAKAASLVNVVDEAMLEPVKMPVASRLSGTLVYENQTVTLECPTEGAVIYYTTDGTCPCDENGTRQVYDGRPIVISADMTLKAMAQSIVGESSEVAEFTYGIRQSDLQLQLHKGWNWLSHNLQNELPSASLKQDAVAQIVGQEGGEPAAILPTEAVKVEATDNAVVTLHGNAFNPNTGVVALGEGWTWMGYPLSTTQTLAEALKNLDAEEGDFIVGREGFAEFTDGEWNTTLLQTLQPGQGYLYKSAQPKSFIYSLNEASKAAAAFGPCYVPAAPWSVNAYDYPSVMAMTIEPHISHLQSIDKTWTLVAYDENDKVRGVGRWEDDLILLPVFGFGGEKVTLCLVSGNADEPASTTCELVFVADALGTHQSPYLLEIEDVTGIATTAAWQTGSMAVYDLSGRRVSVNQHGITVKDGHKYLKK